MSYLLQAQNVLPHAKWKNPYLLPNGKNLVPALQNAKSCGAVTMEGEIVKKNRNALELAAVGVGGRDG